MSCAAYPQQTQQIYEVFGFAACFGKESVRNMARCRSVKVASSVVSPTKKRANKQNVSITFSHSQAGTREGNTPFRVATFATCPTFVSRVKLDIFVSAGYPSVSLTEISFHSVLSFVVRP